MTTTIKSKKRTVTLKRGDFRTVWCNGPEPRSIDVDVFHKERLVIEWRYGRMPGCGTSLMANAMAWEDQAILQAQAEMNKQQPSAAHEDRHEAHHQEGH